MIFLSFLFFSSAELLTNLTKLTLTDLADASDNIQCGFCDGYYLFSVIVFAAFSYSCRIEFHRGLVHINLLICSFATYKNISTTHANRLRHRTWWNYSFIFIFSFNGCNQFPRMLAESHERIFNARLLSQTKQWLKRVKKKKILRIIQTSDCITVRESSFLMTCPIICWKQGHTHSA